MQKNLSFVLLAVISIFCFSCQKSVTANQQQAAVSSSSDDATGRCGNGNWYGVYATEGQQNVFDAPSAFIANGVAQLNNSPWSYFYTSLNLTVPKCHVVVADSVRFVAYLKNPTDQSGSVYPYDVSLWMFGSKDTAHVQFLADFPQYTALTVGSIGVTNTTDLIHLFQDWTEVSLEAKNKRLTVYINGTMVKQIVYKGTKIGALKQIQIGFKGAGIVDWVKLYNSYTNQQIMDEDFNVDGQSNVSWY